MSINSKKRLCFGLVILFCMIALALIAASVATDNWVVSEPKRLAGDSYTGMISFGLFHGSKDLNRNVVKKQATELWIVCSSNHGYCGWSTLASKDQRQNMIDNAFKNGTKLQVEQFRNNQTVLEVIENQGMFPYSMWITTLVMAGLGILWGVVSIVFAFINVSTRPIRTITGPIGLYLWNSLASFFTLLSGIIFTVLYLTTLQKNILEQSDLNNKWSSDGNSRLGYSFWFLIAAVICYLINIVIVLLSGVRCQGLNRKTSMNDATIDGVMMY